MNTVELNRAFAAALGVEGDLAGVVSITLTLAPEKVPEVVVVTRLFDQSAADRLAALVKRLQPAPAPVDEGLARRRADRRVNNVGTPDGSELRAGGDRRKVWTMEGAEAPHRASAPPFVGP